MHIVLVALNINIGRWGFPRFLQDSYLNVPWKITIWSIDKQSINQKMYFCNKAYFLHHVNGMTEVSFGWQKCHFFYRRFYSDFWWQNCHFPNRSDLFFLALTEVSFLCTFGDRSVIFPIKVVTGTLVLLPQKRGFLPKTC